MINILKEEFEMESYDSSSENSSIEDIESNCDCENDINYFKAIIQANGLEEPYGIFSIIQIQQLILDLIDDIQDTEKKCQYYEKLLEITKTDNKIDDKPVMNKKLSKELEIKSVNFNIQDTLNHVLQEKEKSVTISSLNRDINILKSEIIILKEDINNLKQENLLRNIVDD